jgi:hypothetical protein
MSLAIQVGDESKMAVAAKEVKTPPWSGSRTIFIFIVDTTTGSHVGKAAIFYSGGDTTRYSMFVHSQGMLFSAGKIWTAFFSDLTVSWNNDGW